MNRREALSRVALILGGTVVGANVFLEGCKPGDKKAAAAGTFSDGDTAYLDEIAETIIPTTNKKFGKSFMEIDAAQRKALLTEIDAEAKKYMAEKKGEDPKHYFRMMKELTLLGYFTSEIGATQALRYVAVPGKYEGCVPYKKGDRAWAT